MSGLIVSVPDRRLSANFRLYELLESGTAIRLGLDNTPPPAKIASLEWGALHIAQWLRDRAGRLDVSGGFVAGLVNDAIRADQIARYGYASRSKDSQHPRAEALDLVPAHVDRWYLWALVVEGVRAGDLPVDQGIIYADKPHIHVSWASPATGRKPRGDLRFAQRADGKTRYPVWKPWS